MDNKVSNHSIECSVVQCANHADDTKYCALKAIKVGTHEKNPTACQCTDCESFVLGNSSCHCGK